MGKVFTIVYSAIGIPLMMLFLANIGSSTATLFKFIYLRTNQCQRGLRSPLGFFRSKKATAADFYDHYDFSGGEGNGENLDDYDVDDDDDDPDYNDMADLESNKEAFYRDAAIFGGGPAQSRSDMMKLENESSSCNTISSRQQRGAEYVTLKIGLRDIEVERGQLDQFLGKQSR